MHVAWVATLGPMGEEGAFPFGNVRATIEPRSRGLVPAVGVPGHPGAALRSGVSGGR